MTASAVLPLRPPPAPTISASLIVVLAVACGLAAGNSYYAQPLAGPIAQALGIDPQWSGMIVAVLQIGYVAGLVLVVPLGDLLENRRLVSALLVGAGLALLGMAMAPSGPSFLAAGLVVGMASAGTQVIVALAARLAPPETRGHMIGYLASGVFLGILLARPAASLLTYFFNWRVAFLVPAGLMAVVAVCLYGALPNCPAASSNSGYGAALGSLIPLIARTSLLRRRAAYHAAIFGAFSLFWTAVPLLLAGPPYRLTQKGIACFALAGAAGAAFAPFAGRAGDRGWTRPVTGLAILATGLAFVLGMIGASSHSIALLAAAAVVIDLSLSANLVLSQHAILSFRPEVGNRLLGLFRAMFFACGALGSALAGFAYARGGWALVSEIAIGFVAAGMLLFLTEYRAASCFRGWIHRRRTIAALLLLNDRERNDLAIRVDADVRENPEGR